MNRICFALFWIAVALGCGSWLTHTAQPILAGEKGNKQQNAKKQARLALWPTEARGIGTDLIRAKANSYEEARRAVLKFLHDQNPPLKYWEPSRQDVIDFLVDAGKEGGDVKLLPGADAMKTWKLQFKPLNSKTYQNFEKRNDQARRIRAHEERQRRVEQRTILAGKIFLICLVVLIGCFAYMKVQERSNVLIARWLPVAVTGGVICLMAGLWFF